jgi:hypothetical protein
MRIVISLVILLMVGLLSGWFFVARNAAPQSALGANELDVTYICRESGDLFRLPRATGSALHPQTGRATLVAALYCSQCKKWQPAPPAELRDRFPTGPVCREHRTPLVSEGPLPGLNP